MARRHTREGWWLEKAGAVEVFAPLGGGSVIRRALIRRDEAEVTGKNPGVLVSAVAGLPRRLGWRLPR